MSYLDAPVDGPAQANVNRIYDSDRARLGYLPNYIRVFGLQPAAEPASHYRTQPRAGTPADPHRRETRRDRPQRRATYPKRRVQPISLSS